ncbi:expressed hypothetical protein [Trichoplax adhaerens]|uniref:Peptidase S1 domain-containing protein n=1 Tax=Trichoplax adhaerens TaxID=10228 RepID=B3SC31_TRIAD|nr:expressed hypothetical protein [Trichoplax adhaerens]EDV19781.1 expressed hypothetical protein [Trichoplax adhaerens]|eukprot:XP_002117805.1 expressed hypothetical protein [Trichoplax adhaerens]
MAFCMAAPNRNLRDTVKLGASLFRDRAVNDDRFIDDLEEDRIIGGIESIPHSRPYQVALVRSGEFFCGGSLISKQYVITAAHCVVDRIPNEKFEAILGAHNILKEEESQQKIEIEKRIKHEKYSRKTKENDIAIFKLAHPAELNDKVKLIQLAAQNDHFLGKMCSVSGWGTSDDGMLAEEGLRETDVPVISNEKCNALISYGGEIASKMMCAGYAKGGKDGCQGDSGGPLVCKNHQGDEVLGGVVSWGRGCAKPNYYGVYTRVDEYLEWIHSKISKS